MCNIYQRKRETKRETKARRSAKRETKRETKARQSAKRETLLPYYYAHAPITQHVRALHSQSCCVRMVVLKLVIQLVLFLGFSHVDGIIISGEYLLAPQKQFRARSCLISCTYIHMLQEILRHSHLMINLRISLCLREMMKVDQLHLPSCVQLMALDLLPSHGQLSHTHTITPQSLI